MNNPSLDKILILTLKEILARKFPVIIIFSIVSLSILTIGFFWPKYYVSTASIIADRQNVINPLMEGAAEVTNLGKRTQLAKDIIFSKTLMTKVLIASGWNLDVLNPIQIERLAEKVKSRTKIVTSGANLIKISYKDKSPERAYLTAKEYADIFISESVSAKRQESFDAFDFINKQANLYHDKLVNAEEKLKQFRSKNFDARPGTEVVVSNRIATLRKNIQQTKLDIREANIRKKSITKQLTGEADVSASYSKEGIYRAKIIELQSKADVLRLTYFDDYPDIQEIVNQIEVLNARIRKERENRELKLNNVDNDEFVDNNISINPLYQELRSELSKTKTLIETLKVRLHQQKATWQTEIDLAKRIHEVDATQSELTRDYEANSEIYRDFALRREKARVSMNLDLDDKGVTFKIQEPPALPLQPNGLRFLHFLILSLVFGMLIPIGIVYLIIILDPRIRLTTVITEQLDLPILAVLPKINLKTNLKQNESLKAGLLFGLVIAVFIGLSWLKITESMQ
jgi:polysaccharide chain length determinant protein (PEP-CTERM system associated)